MGKVNLKVLSEHLGLTASTVSRALNGYEDISPVTRKRVQQVAQELGYQPSRVAQQLARRQHNMDTIGYVMPLGVHRFSDPFFSRFITGVGDTLAESGRDLLITTPAGSASDLDVYQRLLKENKVNAFIVSRTHLRDARIQYLQNQGVPFVCHGRSENSEHFSWYDVDMFEGAELVAKRFVKQGHRCVALITPPAIFNFSYLLKTGFCQGVQQANDTVEVLFSEGDMSEASGFQLTEKWLKSTPGNPPSAIFCGSDAMAVGALHAIQQQGLRPGADVAVIGYGDFPLASYVFPALTTLRQPLIDAGQTVTRMLLKQLKNPGTEPEQHLLPLTLVERDSDRWLNHSRSGDF